MSAIIILNGEKKEISVEGTIESAMLSLDQHPDSFLYLVNGIPVPMDTPIKDKLTVKAVKVASGG